jgi:WD40 repeat protein
VTLHSDLRIRLWDLSDGKCYAISKQSKWTNSSVLKMLPLFENQERFLIMTDGDGVVSLVDIWNMVILKIDAKTDFPVKDFSIADQKV